MSVGNIFWFNYLLIWEFLHLRARKYFLNIFHHQKRRMLAHEFLAYSQIYVRMKEGILGTRKPNLRIFNLSSNIFRGCKVQTWKSFEEWPSDIFFSSNINHERVKLFWRWDDDVSTRDGILLNRIILYVNFYFKIDTIR